MGLAWSLGSNRYCHDRKKNFVASAENVHPGHSPRESKSSVRDGENAEFLSNFNLIFKEALFLNGGQNLLWTKYRLVWLICLVFLSYTAVHALVTGFFESASAAGKRGRPDRGGATFELHPTLQMGPGTNLLPGGGSHRAIPRLATVRRRLLTFSTYQFPRGTDFLTKLNSFMTLFHIIPMMLVCNTPPNSNLIFSSREVNWAPTEAG